jgi:hypothetical protein
VVITLCVFGSIGSLGDRLPDDSYLVPGGIGVEDQLLAIEAVVAHLLRPYQVGKPTRLMW